MAQPVQPSSRKPALQRARPPIDPTVEPLVGNASVDDNIDEAADLALWKALGADHAAVHPSTVNGVVTLAGTLASPRQRVLAEQAVRAVPGARDVVNNITIAQPADASGPQPGQRRTAIVSVPPRPMVQLVRYCSVDEASLSAALRQAVGIFDAFLESRDLPPATELIVGYRNRQHDTVTMEIGIPVNAEVAGTAKGELHAAIVPHGSFIARQVGPGLPDLLAAETALIELATGMDVGGKPYFWQAFPAEHFRPWQGHPAGKVYLPVRAPDTK